MGLNVGLNVRLCETGRDPNQTHVLSSLPDLGLHLVSKF